MATIDTVDTESGLLLTTFHIGEARFAINAGRVQEIVQPPAITVVHHAPPAIRGVLNLRGRVITVIDLGIRLDLPAIVPGSENRIMIVEWRQEHVGLLVEMIDDVVPVEESAVKPPPENVHGVQASLIAGVCLDQDGCLIGLLDIDRILKPDDDSSIQ